ncbi:hypothetical protein C6503_22710 [Candidatus Poribacteria bacterium]|nr:MAG: hypothetical protein C6503_22710 [Candidatus Poribacteria bacterium]
MWHIAKRELYDNLNSLRFALTTVLLLGLMLTNAVVHLQEHPERIRKYREDIAAYQNRLMNSSKNTPRVYTVRVKIRPKKYKSGASTLPEMLNSRNSCTQNA